MTQRADGQGARWWRIGAPATIILLLVAVLLAILFDIGAGVEEGLVSVRPAVAQKTSENYLSAPNAQPAMAQTRLTEQREPVLLGTTSQPSVGLDSFLVQVVTGLDKTPVPGALVLARVSNKDANEAPYDISRVDEWMEEHGVLIVADERGIVRVPASSETGVGTLVLGQAEELWGYEEIAAPPLGEIAPLVLTPDFTFAVRVVDAHERPIAEVNVTLSSEGGGWIGGSGPDPERKTGDDGVAEFPHAQVHRDSYGGTARQWYVELNVLAIEPVRQDIDLVDNQREPLRIHLAPTGTVVVHLLDVDHSSWTAPTTVKLVGIRSNERSEAEVETDNGTARFTVSLGFDVVAVSATRQDSSVVAHAAVPNIQIEGELVHSTVVFGTEYPLIEMCVLDAKGVPLIEQPLIAVVDSSSRHGPNGYYLETLSVVTNHLGRIRIDLDGKFDRRFVNGDRRTILLALGSDEEPVASALVNLSMRLAPGLISLPDVALTPPGLFVAGRVIDSNSNPVSATWLHLERFDPTLERWDTSFNSMGFSGEVLEDGTFHVRAMLAAEQFRLRAYKRGMTGQPREFSPGEPNLVLTLLESMSITGSVRVNDGVVGSMFVATATQEGSRNRDPGEWVDVDSDGAFVLPVHSGRWDVALWLGDYLRSEGVPPVPLHEVKGVVVAPGSAPDPRLQGIDLRSNLFARKISLLLPETQSLSGRIDYAYGAAGDRILRQKGWTAGEDVIKIVTVEREIDVAIAVRGFELVRLSGVTGDCTARLVPSSGGCQGSCRLS